MYRPLIAFLVVFSLPGCSSAPTYEGSNYVSREWFTPEHVDRIIQENPRPSDKGEFETTRQYHARIEPTEDQLKRVIEIPVQNTLRADYDADKQRVSISVEAASGFFETWKALNDVSVYDVGARYPDISFNLPLEEARENFSPSKYGLVVFGRLRDFPTGYISLDSTGILIYDRETYAVLATSPVR
jgi:hypothetical protein